jgi:aminopeptidase N
MGPSTARPALIGVAVAVMLTSCGGGQATPTSTSSGTTTSPATTAPSVTAPPTTDPARPGHRAPAAGDPYFPQLGTRGYDAEHYLIELTVDPDGGSITDATTTMTATALQDLALVDLDLVGMEVVGTHLDGVPVGFERREGKLTVVAPAVIRAGDRFVTRVEYRGRPEPFFIPGFDTRAGWVVTAEGIHVVAEPDGAHTWFPSNDHPSDKALFTIAVTVPEPFDAVSNGTLVDRAGDTDGYVTFVWEMDAPMATYLATVVVGEFVTVERPAPAGIAIADHLPADLASSPLPPLERTAEMLTFLSDWFGPYPFSSYGHVVVSDFSIALETQTMTVIGRRALSEGTVVHELAHQWFGNSVSVATWQDIWLNEGFASFAELLWIERELGHDAMIAEVERRHAVLSQTPHRPIADPGASDMFGTAVYWRGALSLHALRATIGDGDLRRVFREYTSRFRHGNATTGDFIDLAEEVSGRPLEPLFDEWLHRSDLPPLPG